jgi:hypothetical protein
MTVREEPQRNANGAYLCATCCYAPATEGGNAFYERGCQVKTLLLLEEGLVLLGIQPPSMISAILNARVRPGFSMDERARRRWFGA